MTDKPLYYTRGDHVWKRSVETKNADGSSNYTLGFKICTASEYVAVKEIAKALNIAAGKPEA